MLRTPMAAQTSASEMPSHAGFFMSDSLPEQLRCSGNHRDVIQVQRAAAQPRAAFLIELPQHAGLGGRQVALLVLRIRVELAGCDLHSRILPAGTKATSPFES